MGEGTGANTPIPDLVVVGANYPTTIEIRARIEGGGDRGFGHRTRGIFRKSGH